MWKKVTWFKLFAIKASTDAIAKRKGCNGQLRPEARPRAGEPLRLWPCCVPSLFFSSLIAGETLPEEAQALSQRNSDLSGTPSRTGGFVSYKMAMLRCRASFQHSTLCHFANQS